MKFFYPGHRDCQTRCVRKQRTIEALTDGAHDMLKTFRKAMGAAISLAGFVVLVTQQL
ncbi:hypothetical protein ABIC89_006428 [Variovorax boronicumulans]|uniref:hypothetical protein n=1 Tax=Variovorax boronicumulans TaxID=436515 RepID=UPI003394795D